MLALGEFENLSETLLAAIKEVGLEDLSVEERTKLRLLLGSALMSGKTSDIVMAWRLLEGAYYDRGEVTIAHPSLGVKEPSNYAYGELGLERLYGLVLELSDLSEGPLPLRNDTLIAEQLRHIGAEAITLHNHYERRFPDIARLLTQASSSMSQ